MRRFCFVFAKTHGFGPAGHRVYVVSPLMDKVKYRSGPEPPQAASVNRHEDASVNGLDTEHRCRLSTRDTTFHEAVARGSGCDGVLRRRIRTRHDPGLAAGAPGVDVDFRSGEIWNDQEGQEEEGEEAGEFYERVRCVADEVNALFPVPNPTIEDPK